MVHTLTHTDLHLPGQDHVYHGKVRDVYFLRDGRIAMVATDRISAFDVVLPEGIPYKGQVLNQIATYFLEATRDIVPNWLLCSPDPMVSLGHRLQPFRVEMVIRGYLTGSAWRAYQAGERSLCGVPLPEGMRENEAFAQPIITPTTKEDEGHDENISREEIIRTGLVSEEDYRQIEAYTYALFRRGQEMARERGLILVDTKYEFGKNEAGEIFLIDEILAVGDEPFQRKCLDEIRGLSDQGKTLVIVSHDLNMVSDLCERGVLLDKGVKVADGPSKDVVRRMRGE